MRLYINDIIQFNLLLCYQGTIFKIVANNLNVM